MNDAVGTLCTWINRATSYWQTIPPVKESKRVLLVQCHPVPTSFNAACARAAATGLRAAGHEVRFKTLYSDESIISTGTAGSAFNGRDFPPALTATERAKYHDIAADIVSETQSDSKLCPEVAEAVADLRWAQALVLVYPTWWMNVPGPLKGWLDRTFLPHVAFRLPKQALPGDSSPTETGLQPLLTNIERVGVVTTYGASPWIVAAAGDNGRRMISHALRPLFAPGCALRWHGLHDMDGTTPEQREEFLTQVEEAYRQF
mmetsp:Transcript_34843/g.71150  ORF Transcript_34843/g.71150 Transcript_34843/m.71150 type:complete len:260 (+) Transcript_34843:73-852(+)